MTEPIAPARVERGWATLLLAVLAFLLIPSIPQVRAVLPIEQTMFLFVPALAACSVVGWWAGGRPLIAVAWIALAALLATRSAASPGIFNNLQRGWSLLCAGAFGLVCLFGVRRPFFVRALVALTISLLLVLVMSTLGPVSGPALRGAVAGELAQRNAEAMAKVNGFIGNHSDQWGQLTSAVPQLATLPGEMEKQLKVLAVGGAILYPSLLALESLVALALAWATYHRLSRARLGPPLAPLRDFRFNDQLVWGLIVGLPMLWVPALSAFSSAGWNLLVFFGALYAIRGLGVLSWFLAPGALAVTATVGFAMLWAPVLNAVAAFGFMFLALAAFGLGLGDTWADWRSRVRPTS